MGTELNKQMKSLQKKASDFGKKWRIPLLVIGIGLLLVLLPFGSRKKAPADVTQPETEFVSVPQLSYAEQTERRLCEILSAVDGAGKVEVMLTVQGSEVTYFQNDCTISSAQDEDGTSSSTQYKTVILSGSGEYDKAAVTKTEYPAFRGALIVSEGADDPAVRLALVNAVSSLLGLGTDKISVVKMK